MTIDVVKISQLDASSRAAFTVLDTILTNQRPDIFNDGKRAAEWCADFVTTFAQRLRDMKQ